MAFLRSAVSFEGLTRGEIFSRLFFWWFGPGFVAVFLSLWFDFRLSREPLFSLIGPALTALVVWRDATRARLANPLFLAAVAGLVTGYCIEGRCERCGYYGELAIVKAASEKSRVSED